MSRAYVFCNRALHWSIPANQPDNEFCETTYNTPVEVRCRWQVELTEVLNADAPGSQTQTSSAKVYLPVDVKEGEFLLLLNDGEATKDFADAPEANGIRAQRILTVRKIKNLRGNKTEIRAMLK